MPGTNLQGKRILVTQADDFMGPTLCQVLAEHGAEVIASTASLIDADAPAALMAASGHIDVLIANLAVPAPRTEAIQVSEDEWRHTFAALVDPLPGDTTVGGTAAAAPSRTLTVFVPSSCRGAMPRGRTV